MCSLVSSLSDNLILRKEEKRYCVSYIELQNSRRKTHIGLRIAGVSEHNTVLSNYNHQQKQRDRTKKRSDKYRYKPNSVNNRYR